MSYCWKDVLSNVGSHASMKPSEIRGLARPIDFQAPVSTFQFSDLFHGPSNRLLH